MAVLNSCLCWKLQTGSLVIGWLYLVCGIVGIFGALLFGFLGEIVVNLGLSEQPNNEELKSEHMKVVRSVEFAIIGIQILNIVTSIILLIGIYKNRRFMLLPWLVMNSINCLTVVIGVGGLFVYFLYGEEIPGVILTLFIGLGLIGLLVYVWLCIFSLYQKISFDDNKRARGMDEVQFIASAPIAENTMPLYPSLN